MDDLLRSLGHPGQKALGPARDGAPDPDSGADGLAFLAALSGAATSGGATRGKSDAALFGTVPGPSRISGSFVASMAAMPDTETPGAPVADRPMIIATLLDMPMTDAPNPGAPDLDFSDGRDAPPLPVAGTASLTPAVALVPEQVSAPHAAPALPQVAAPIAPAPRPASPASVQPVAASGVTRPAVPAASMQLPPDAASPPHAPIADQRARPAGATDLAQSGIQRPDPARTPVSPSAASPAATVTGAGAGASAPGQPDVDADQLARAAIRNAAPPAQPADRPVVAGPSSSAAPLPQSSDATNGTATLGTGGQSTRTQPAAAQPSAAPLPQPVVPIPNQHTSHAEPAAARLAAFRAPMESPNIAAPSGAEGRRPPMPTSGVSATTPPPAPQAASAPVMVQPQLPPQPPVAPQLQPDLRQPPQAQPLPFLPEGAPAPEQKDAPDAARRSVRRWPGADAPSPQAPRWIGMATPTMAAQAPASNLMAPALHPGASGGVELALGAETLSATELGLGAPSTGPAPVSAPAFGQAHAMPATAQTVAQQIAAALAESRSGADGPVELALDPPELGRLRLHISELAGVMTLTIHADRPETADLIRRHLDLLAREFTQSGLDAPSVRISQDNSGGPGRDARGDPGAEPQRNAAPEDTAIIRTAPTSTHTGALDLRL